MVREENLLRFVPVFDNILSSFVGGAVLAPQIPLRVDDETLPPSEGFFEEGVARGQGHAVVAAFDYKVDVREHGDHL